MRSSALKSRLPFFSRTRNQTDRWNEAPEWALSFPVFLVCLVVLAASVQPAHSQMPRERSSQAAADDLFWAPSVVILPSVTHVGKGMMDFQIQHAFGLLDDGANGLWGLDAPANIRFGFEIGLSDNVTLDIGRSRFNKVFDFGLKGTVYEKSRVQIGLLGTAGIETLKDGRSAGDRMSFYSGALVAARVTPSLVIQALPSLAHFNLVADGMDNSAVVLGLVGKWDASDQVAVYVETLPVLSGEVPGAETAFSVGTDLEVGGHVFQLFLTTSQWMTPQHAVFLSRDSIADRDVRLGFNVHRVFGLR